MTSWSLGRLRIVKVTEWAGPTRPSWLFPDASPEAVARHREWLLPHFLDERQRLLTSIHSFVVAAPGLTVLVDTCVGNDKPRQHADWHMQARPFLDDLARAGFPLESIDVVLCTHLHVDHVGWNTRLRAGRWVPTFPRARYLIGRREWEYWSAAEGEEDRTIMADSVRPVLEAGQVELVDADHRLADGLWLEPTPGHTPGHVSLALASGAERAVITGDLMHHPIQCGEPGWNSHFCVDAEAARATRRAFLERCAGTPVRVLGTHFAGPTAGWVTREGGAFQFRAEGGA